MLRLNQSILQAAEAASAREIMLLRHETTNFRFQTREGYYDGVSGRRRSNPCRVHRHRRHRPCAGYSPIVICLIYTFTCLPFRSINAGEFDVFEGGWSTKFRH